MGIGDKFDAAKDKVTGKVNEAVGDATDDRSREMKGKAQQVEGEAKDKLADAKAHLNEDANRATDDTEGGGLR
ncbi:CsbD family protein [Arthrobacter sulfonylureivorans]|uniref:CsbD family protein n=1 Tax=Arthrobacter sulfonylureivorans TaxID=2486855 RepID=UPI0039E6BCC5